MTLSLDAYWMPYTANRQFKRDPRIIESAEGVWFTDAHGRKVLDGHSGLWTSGLGHARPEITEAVSQQMARLDFCPPFQFGHPKAFELATKIAALMPADLNHVFYTNSGSESADTSLKMARAYWQLKGETSKTRFIGRQKGYHGVNFGGVAVGGNPANKGEKEEEMRKQEEKEEEEEEEDEDTPLALDRGASIEASVFASLYEVLAS